jgi:Transcription factor TFIID (or TATA-binding protein, TBP)
MTDSCLHIGNQFDTTSTDIVTRHCDLTLTSYQPVATVASVESQFGMNAANLDVGAGDASYSDIAADEPVIDIVISNVVCTFNTKCHLNLKRLATEGMNVVYKREQGVK